MKWHGRANGSRRVTGICFILTLILVVGALLIVRMNALESNPDQVAFQRSNDHLHDMTSSLSISDYLQH